MQAAVEAALAAHCGDAATENADTMAYIAEMIADEDADLSE